MGFPTETKHQLKTGDEVKCYPGVLAFGQAVYKNEDSTPGMCAVNSGLLSGRSRQAVDLSRSSKARFRFHTTVGFIPRQSLDPDETGFLLKNKNLR